MNLIWKAAMTKTLTLSCKSFPQRHRPRTVIGLQATDEPKQLSTAYSA
ncbi:MAG: hypothetical protein ACOH1X_00640 [Kaistella sp.]